MASVQLAQQVEKVPRHFFAKHVVINGAQRAADRVLAVLAGLAVRRAGAGCPAAATGFAGPTQPLVPLEREHMRLILPIIITRRIAPSRYRKIIGVPKELSPGRASRQSGHGRYK